MQLYALPDCQVIRFSDFADFYLFLDTIHCHLLDPAAHHLVELYFLGRVLAFWQESQNQSVLHASSVVINQQAVAFVAVRGTGKSAVAATFLQAGYPLLADDIVALQIQDQQVYAQAGYPQMRMWPDEAAHFLGDYQHFPLVLPDMDKRRVPVGAGGIGTFCTQSKPLAAIYLLERCTTEAIGEKITVEPLSSSQAIFHLTAHAFAADCDNRVETQQQRIQRLVPVVRRVPVYRLRYPSGFSYLPSVRQAILAEIL